MASSYVTANKTANGSMFPYIFLKSSITKATQNTAFLSDINFEFCSSYGFAIGKQCCIPLMQSACYLLPSLVSKP
jgi:pectin methylesterase-like acyl-CoA thioesterase